MTEPRIKQVRLGEVDVKIEMPMARVVWLDTSVILHWAQHLSGRNRDARFDALIPVLRDGISKGTLVVVEGDQEEEVLRDNWRDFRSLMRQLAGKARFEDNSAIEEHELFVLMRSWALVEPARISRSKVFSRATFEVPGESPWVISVVHGDEAARRRLGSARRKATAAAIDEARGRFAGDPLSFEDARGFEIMGYLRAMMKLSERGQARLVAESETLEARIEAGALSRLHGILKAATKDENVPFQRLEDFFASDHAAAVPSFRVSCGLWAHMMIDSAPVVGGDVGDLGHLQVAIPYSDVVVADKSMVYKVKARGLDREFETSVFAMRDFDGLLASLRVL